MIRITGLSLAIAILVGMGTVASATPILDGAGNAVGVTDILVDGLLYDAMFHVGSYNSVFGAAVDPDPLPTFDGDPDGAQEALQGIVAQLNANQVSRVADASTGALADSIIVPDYHSDTYVSGPWSGTSAPLPWGDGSSIGTPRTVTGAFSRTYAYATFTGGAVPEPGTFALLGLGGLGLATLVVRRRKTTRAA